MIEVRWLGSERSAQSGAKTSHSPSRPRSAMSRPAVAGQGPKDRRAPRPTFAKRRPHEQPLSARVLDHVCTTRKQSRCRSAATIAFFAKQAPDRTLIRRILLGGSTSAVAPPRWWPAWRSRCAPGEASRRGSRRPGVGARRACRRLQGPARGGQIAKFAYAEFALSATGRWSPEGRSWRSRCRHCDRPVRASASARAVVPSPVSRRYRLGDRARLGNPACASSLESEPIIGKRSLILRETAVRRLLARAGSANARRRRLLQSPRSGSLARARSQAAEIAHRRKPAPPSARLSLLMSAPAEYWTTYAG